ncbi:hypothetical protein FISHEDRAFT_63039, partial [Fistulina hepatica ATCC 64428]
ATQQEAERQREALATELAAFRIEQARVMCNVADQLTEEYMKDVEVQRLFLPSSLTQEDRDKWQLSTLSEVEANLREGAIHDEQGNIMTAVALVSSGRRCQRKQASGQDANTRAQRIIQKHKSMLTEAIARYNGHRAALIELRQYADPAKECQFRHVELKDVFRKNTVETRRLGDSKRNEGAIYHGAGTPQPVRMRSASSTKGEKMGTFGTVATKKNKGPPPHNHPVPVRVMMTALPSSIMLHFIYMRTWRNGKNNRIEFSIFVWKRTS